MAKKKILVVDDEPELVKILKIWLEDNNYEVITAGDGAEGLERAKNERPHLTILDVMMPEMGGFKTCIKLKESSETRRIPVLMLTSKGGGVDRQLGLNCGADAYLGKPYDLQNLLDKVSELINKSDDS